MRKAVTPVGYSWAQTALALRRHHGVRLRSFDSARRAHLDLIPPWVDLRAGDIIDVGANVGDWTAYVRAAVPGAAILAIEPDPETFQRLRDRIGESAGVRLLNRALSDRPGRADFRVTAGSEFGSLLEPASDALDIYGSGAPVRKRIEVETVTLDSLTDSRRVSLIKLDVQGAELAVISGGRQTLARTDVVLVEINFRNFYEGGATFGHVHESLTSLGFVLWQMTEGAFLPDQGMLWADACYARPG